MIEPSQRILVVEDDENTASLLALYLRKAGFEVLGAADGHQALALARHYAPSLIVLDLMLPGITGWEICEGLRQHSQVPILILSARQEEADRLLGLQLGADDYVVKPFSPRELVARVKAILRRTGASPARPPAVYRYRELELDCEQHRVSVSGQAVELTLSEFTLLRALLSARGRVLTRQDLLDHLYPGRDAVVDRVVDVHIGKLRQKLGPALSRCIHTVRGVGYRFAGDER